MAFKGNIKEDNKQKVNVGTKRTEESGHQEKNRKNRNSEK